jgi:hypothetical protein
MTHVEHTRSLPDLLGTLATDISGLFRKEIQLAKAEASEKVDHVMHAAAKLAIGAVLAIGAIGVLLAAIVSGLTAIFTGMGMDPAVASTIASLVVAGVVGVAAWMSVSAGLEALKAEKLNMDRTAGSLARDAAVVTEKF